MMRDLPTTPMDHPQQPAAPGREVDLIERYSVEYLSYNNISRARSMEAVARIADLLAMADDDMTRVDGPLFRSFLQRQVEAGKAPTTVGKIRGLIRPFFHWAWSERIIDANQLMDLNAVKPPRGASKQGRPRPYSREEIKKLWADWDREYPIGAPDVVDMNHAVAYLERFESGHSSFFRVKPLANRLQMRAIISLGLMGGLRRAEIYGLKLEDIHFENAYLVVNGARKNADAESVQRIVPWATGDLRFAIEEWLDLRERLAPDHDSPWLALWGRHTYANPLSWEKFLDLMHRLGRGWEYHRLRHTAATEMLRAGYPLETVQKVMGHSRLQQTLAYAELLTDDVVKIAGRCEMNLSAALNHQPEPELEPAIGG